MAQIFILWITNLQTYFDNPVRARVSLKLFSQIEIDLQSFECGNGGDGVVFTFHLHNDVRLGGCQSSSLDEANIWNIT